MIAEKAPPKAKARVKPAAAKKPSAAPEAQIVEEMSKQFFQNNGQWKLVELFVEMKQMRAESNFRFDSIHKEIEVLRENTNRRFEEQREEMNRRFAEMIRYVDKQFTSQKWFIGIVVTLALGIANAPEVMGWLQEMLTW